MLEPNFEKADGLGISIHFFFVVLLDFHKLDEWEVIIESDLKTIGTNFWDQSFWTKFFGTNFWRPNFLGPIIFGN